MIGGMQRRTPAVLERPLATTIAGSLPKPGWLAETERLWPSWRLDGAVLDEAKRDAVRLAVFEQDLAGIDVVTDGEQTRRHFVHGFLEGLEGIDRTRLVRRGIRADRYEADCPSIVGGMCMRNQRFPPGGGTAAVFSHTSSAAPGSVPCTPHALS